MYNRKILALLLAFAPIGAAAHADGWYIGGSVGVNTQSDSDNSGQTGAFTTGNLGDGSTLDVADGTPYGWNTEFESGVSYALEAGLRYDSGWRSGIEIARTGADVDTHSGVTLGGGDIGSLDAASIAGSPTALGVSVADVVADGQGEITNTAIFVNAYYDFNRGGTIEPYLGVGIGYSDVDVTYKPSNIGVIDGSEGKFAYQARAGATYALSNNWGIFGEYTYRATEDVEFQNQLFPGTLEIENQSHIFAIGARYRFDSL
ncbi:outer membrane beta-barrel protein [Henriciella sp. AS95]|uniref:outer membrane protein n=1 Tax=Henriciella sp. AS95 TaxID=3135782 RepID=UPI003182B152